MNTLSEANKRTELRESAMAVTCYLSELASLDDIIRRVESTLIELRDRRRVIEGNIRSYQRHANAIDVARMANRQPPISIQADTDVVNDR